jgi:nitrate/nitrite transport system substrate-binding protein
MTKTDKTLQKPKRKSEFALTRRHALLGAAATVAAAKAAFPAGAHAAGPGPRSPRPGWASSP